MEPSPPADEVVDIVQGTVVGGYTVERMLGAGGYGSVYRARERGGGLYALKFLRLEEVGRWGEREVAVLLRLQHLSHPHVVRMLSHTLWPVAAPEYVVIVMEYVRGRSLSRWARDVNPSARAVARVVLDVARALEAVHREGVVHRDVKGGNVLVGEPDGRAVLADFGVGSYAGAPGLTLRQVLPGTPEYRSPEAWRHLRDNAGPGGARYVPVPADDLWALGVTLYWLLTDRHPFEAPDNFALADCVLFRVPPPPREVNPRVPEALGRLCLWMLEKAPEARPADASAVVAALEEVLGGADMAWDVALCEFHDACNATTAGREGDLFAWADAPERPPRRGPRRPMRVSEGADGVPGARLTAEVVLPVRAGEAARLPAEAGAPAPIALPPAEADVPVPTAPLLTEPRWRPTASALLAVALLTVAAVSMGWWASQWRMAPTPRPPEAAPTTRQEVASVGPPPDAGLAAVPPPVVVPPVAAAPIAALAKDSAPVKTPPPAPSWKNQVSQATAVAGACLSLSCSGPQVVRAASPRPAPEDCPQRALDAMERLGARIGDEGDAIFAGYEVGIITVHAGSVPVELGGGYSDKLRGRSVLQCQLTLGDRVYGRCYSVRNSRYGETYPVCFELHHRNGVLGIERKDAANADSARLFNSFNVRPVRRFE